MTHAKHQQEDSYFIFQCLAATAACIAFTVLSAAIGAETFALIGALATVLAMSVVLIALSNYSIPTQTYYRSQPNFFTSHLDRHHTLSHYFHAHPSH